MRLNDIKPAAGSKHSKKRVGRGFGCHGKTAGRGHKGQKSRAGGFHKVGFEGGQMPLQRRLPKRGFASLYRDDTIDFAALKAAGVVSPSSKRAKVILSGEIKRKIALKGLLVSKGARAAIEAAGGSVELPAPAAPVAAKRERQPGKAVKDQGESEKPKAE